MAAEIKETLGVQAELEKLSGGIFEVYLNGELLFSKKKVSRFPEPGEVIQLLNDRLK